MSSNIKLRLESVVKRYHHEEVVKGISLAIQEGQFVTILGPSGSGKTTLLRMIVGFLKPTSGTLWLDKKDITNLAPGSRGIGMVFQNYALFPHMTVAENIRYPLKMRKWPKAQQQARVQEILALVGLQGYGERLPRQLSGGQQQRVAVGRALAFKPELLLMDEPLGALDRELRIYMAAELRRMHSMLGNTILYVTHDREEALTLSDQIIILRNGKIQALGTPQELYSRPQTAFVASFFGGHNVVPCDATEQLGAHTIRVKCMGKTLDVNCHNAAHMQDRVALSIPGDAIELLDSDEAGQCIPATIESATYMGNQSQVVCKVSWDDKSIQLRIDHPGTRQMPPGPGSNVFLQLNLAMVVAVNEYEGDV